MPSGRTVKLLLYELVQFTCLCVPVFVVLERFASLMRSMRSNDATVYWLVVAVSIAYVTTVTMFIWLPLKYFILKSRSFLTDVSNWRPVTLAFVVLSTLPCFAIVLTISKVQANAGIYHDSFSDIPVSLVLFALLCVDIVERIRPYRLTGQADSLESDFEYPGPVLTHLEQVPSVSAQLQTTGGENGSISEHLGDMSRFSVSRSSSAYLYSSQAHSSPLHWLWVRDPRHGLFVDTFLFWLDTVEMVRVAGLEAIFYSPWVFPVYILAYLSMLRVVVTPNSPVLVALGVLSQDLPYLVVRISLIGIFGHVTPVLYVMKNLLGCLSFVYFLLLTKLKMFNRRSMF
ncbi:transmembrane protein 236 [Brachyhypopomus gauderio]|uniref:transmembrane protein 236 n=1 Tax=Brachyhypopomus gauderio TaxID=698409 RepID=UPI004041F2FC